MDCIYHSHKSWPSTLAPLCHHYSGTLTYLFQVLAFPFKVMWNAFVSPPTATDSHLSVAMSEPISHCYKNCLVRCEEKWVWKLWGQWTSRRSQLFMWTSCGDVIVTAQTFIVTINRDIRTFIHI
jgi:hypothetical protein